MYTLMRDLELKPSRRLGLWLAGLLTLTLAAIALADLPVWLRLALAAMVLGLGVRARRRAAALPALRIGADGGLQGLDDAGEWQALAVQDESFVSPALVVVRYRVGTGRMQALTLLPDSLPPDDWRRLRVSLRWIPRTRSDTSSPDAG